MLTGDFIVTIANINNRPAAVSLRYDEGEDFSEEILSFSYREKDVNTPGAELKVYTFKTKHKAYDLFNKSVSHITAKTSRFHRINSPSALASVAAHDDDE